MNAPDVILVTPHDLSDETIERRAARALSAAPAGSIAVQLRMPGRPAGQVLRLAEVLRDVTRSHGAMLLINDRIDIARAVDADGIHLGGGSIGVADARQFLRKGAGGEDAEMFVSLAAHTLTDVAAARESGADAVLVSPIFETPKKGTPRGFEVISEAAQKCGPVRVYALGGVDVTNATSCIDAGAHGVAVIRAVWSSADVEKAVDALVSSVRLARG